MVCAVHPLTDDVLQSELGVLLALNYWQDVKDEMVFVLFHPCDSPSRSLVFKSMTFFYGK
jgi:hypothetical protein